MLTKIISPNVADVISPTNDVELQLLHAGDFALSMEVSISFKNAKTLATLSTLEVTLCIQLLTLLSYFCLLNLLDELVDCD